MSRRELAARLSVHMQTVTKWEREGLIPAQPGGKGRASLYDEVAVRAWLQLRAEAANKPDAMNLVQERARRERAQAVLAEQAAQIRSRELLPSDEVEKAWSDRVAAARTKLLSWGTALSDRVARIAVTEGVAGVQRVIEVAVDEVLRELARPGFGKTAP